MMKVDLDTKDFIKKVHEAVEASKLPQGKINKVLRRESNKAYKMFARYVSTTTGIPYRTLTSKKSSRLRLHKVAKRPKGLYFRAITTHKGGKNIIHIARTKGKGLGRQRGDKIRYNGKQAYVNPRWLGIPQNLKGGNRRIYVREGNAKRLKSVNLPVTMAQLYERRGSRLLRISTVKIARGLLDETVARIKKS